MGEISLKNELNCSKYLRNSVSILRKRQTELFSLSLWVFTNRRDRWNFFKDSHETGLMKAWVCMCVSLLSQPALACVVTGQGMGAGPGCHCHVSHTLSFLSPCPPQYSTSLALLIYPSSVFFAHSGKLTTYKGGYILNKSVPRSPL